jgi:hypothetical protein
MNLNQFVVATCANRQSNGSCLGANFDDRLQPLPGTSRAVCRICDGIRCPYFESTLIPLADGTTDPATREEYQNAVAKYRKLHGLTARMTRPCPDCGGALQKNKRLCPACAERRRRKTYRTAQRKRRGDSAMNAGGTEQPTT